jgi:hypothetical protein
LSKPFSLKVRLVGSLPEPCFACASIVVSLCLIHDKAAVDRQQLARDEATALAVNRNKAAAFTSSGICGRWMARPFR